MAIYIKICNLYQIVKHIDHKKHVNFVLNQINKFLLNLCVVIEYV